MKHVDNLGVGRFAHAAWILVPALAATLGVSGVVSRPALGLEATQSMRSHAEARVAEREHEAERARGLLSRGGEKRLDELHDAVVASIPAPISPLDTQGLMSLAARRAGLALETIEIGDPTDGGFALLEDRIVSTRVDVRAHGSLASVVDFVDLLRGAGLALSVDDAVLARTRASERAFDVRLSLSFHHRAARGSTSGAENRGDS